MKISTIRTIYKYALLAKLFIALAVLFAFGCLIASIQFKQSRYASITHSITVHLENVRTRRPLTINSGDWNDMVDWAQTCRANCLLNGYVTLVDYSEFESDMRSKLDQPDLDVQFFAWYWDRVAAISTVGSRYNSQYRDAAIKTPNAR